MDKKASMELGVNAIIILIIALAILGLAMSFVTGLFKGGQKKLGGLIERTDLPVHADSTNPIVFDSSDVTIKISTATKSTQLIVSVYNTNFGDSAVGLTISSCVDPRGNEITTSGCTGDTCEDPDFVPTDYFTIAAPRQKITPGSDGGYKAIVKAGPQATSTTDSEAAVSDLGTYICTITTQSYDTDGTLLVDAPTASQQIFITATA
jgi:hypothetical protein